MAGAISAYQKPEIAGEKNKTEKAQDQNWIRSSKSFGALISRIYYPHGMHHWGTQLCHGEKKALFPNKGRPQTLKVLQVTPEILNAYIEMKIKNSHL